MGCALSLNTGSSAPSCSSIPEDTRDPNRLLSLPNEILLLIAEYFSQSDVCSFLSTNRRLAHLMTPVLHKFAVKDRNPMTALQWAVWRGHIRLVKLLLEKGFDTNYSPKKDDLLEWPWTPLCYGVRSGKVALVRLLLENGALIDTQNKYGETAVHMAVYTLVMLESKRNISFGLVQPSPIQVSDMAAVLQLLLESKPNLSIQDSIGHTALHGSALKCNDKTTAMKLLLEHGAPVNTRASDGKTALHLAADFGSEATVRLLLKYGAKVSAKDNNGVTPLHMAAFGGHNHIVRLLVRNGSNF